MTLQIVEDALLKPIQTHAANVRRMTPKTTAKPRLTATLHSRLRRY
jgi:hypothetical protein